ncbi:hypothetical protein [Arsenicibacter rosenii]|nr:hypothetical protein [Arsenicibacter rosenii]
MKNLFLTLFLSLSGLVASAQEGQPVANGASKPLEFQIPVSAAFDLLGVNPSTVMRPGNIRDFKVDWSFQSYRLRPNLAIQAQPVWELFYNRPNLRKYQRAPKLMKMLSTLDISAGTVEQQTGENLFDRRLAIAGKMTLFRSKDPLDDEDLFRESTETYYQQRERLLLDRNMWLDSLNRLPPVSEHLNQRDFILTRLNGTEQLIEDMDKRQKTKISELSTLFVKQHWNASFLDVAYGRAYTFANPGLDSLKLSTDGWSVWANGCFGIGRRFLISGLIRYTAFTQRTRQNRLQQQLTAGLNIRYGSPKFNFFAEVIQQANEKLTLSDQFTMAYGGDWRFSRNVMLSYAVRTIYNRPVVLKNLVPVVSISCMMR